MSYFDMLEAFSILQTSLLENDGEKLSKYFNEFSIYLSHVHLTNTGLNIVQQVLKVSRWIAKQKYEEKRPIHLTSPGERK